MIQINIGGIEIEIEHLAELERFTVEIKDLVRPILMENTALNTQVDELWRRVRDYEDKNAINIPQLQAERDAAIAVRDQLQRELDNLRGSE